MADQTPRAQRLFSDHDYLLRPRPCVRRGRAIPRRTEHRAATSAAANDFPDGRRGLPKPGSARSYVFLWQHRADNRDNGYDCDDDSNGQQNPHHRGVLLTSDAGRSPARDVTAPYQPVDRQRHGRSSDSQVSGQFHEARRFDLVQMIQNTRLVIAEPLALIRVSIKNYYQHA